jgi:hypothetical protein
MTGLSGARLDQNRRAGRAWELACLRHLRIHGWPGAERHNDKHASDIVGVWDIALECTLASWDKIHMKVRQAEADATRRGLPYWCVWKKSNGKADPGEGLVVLPAHVFFGLVARLESAEAKEAV